MLVWTVEPARAFIVFSDYYGNASFLILSVWFVILPPPATKQKPQFLLLQDKKAPSCTSSSCFRPAVPAVAVQWQQAGWPYYNLAQAKIMIIWLGQKLWLFGSGKNYDYLAQAQIMIIWLRHKLWKFDSSQNYENVAVAPNQQKKRISRLLAPYKRLHRSYTVALCLQFTFLVQKA